MLNLRKAFFKFINLTVYGKTIKNPAKRSDIMLYTEIEKSRQLARKPYCIDLRLFSKKFISVQVQKYQV